MIEIYTNLYIGTTDDYEISVKNKDNWCVVHACKEPYHRRELGYSTPGAPKNHPEYLIAHRGNRLILNLVDAPNQAYISKEIIDAALEFTHQNLLNQKKVLVHCNMGESRSPRIGLLYLGIHTTLLPKSFAQAEQAFKAIYPFYNPGVGMRGFLLSNWRIYIP